MLRKAVATAHAVSDQTGAGSDMHIQLPFRPALYAKVPNNPSFKEFQEYVRLGEQATWPQLEMIRDRTRLSRLFGTYIGALMKRIAGRAVSRETRSGSRRQVVVSRTGSAIMESGRYEKLSITANLRHSAVTRKYSESSRPPAGVKPRRQAYHD